MDGKSIHIINDGGPGFHGEAEVHSLSYTFGAMYPAVLGIPTVTVTGNTITFDPGDYHFDLGNNYHIIIDEGAFVGKVSGMGNVGGAEPLAINFSTVTPGTGDVNRAGRRWSRLSARQENRGMGAIPTRRGNKKFTKF